MQLATILAIALVLPTTVLAQTKDLNTLLMHSTVRIQGPASAPGKNAEGSVFFLSFPISGSTNWNWNIMVTAAHVLDDIVGDTALLFLHKPINDGFQKITNSIAIRKDGKALWYKHPQADVAVMIAPLAKDYLGLVKFVPASFLADDSTWEARFIHPGDVVNCLGFPLGLESSAAGFPILRSGPIASFPLLPSKSIKTFQLDLRVFGGNSGGPVYFQFFGRRPFLDFQSPQVDCSGILGVMIQDVSYVQSTDGYFGSTSRRDPLGISIVVHATFVKEAIESLLAEKSKSAQP